MTIASALVEIHPDFARFEAELTRGLKEAAERAEKAAEVTIKAKLDDSQARAFEKAFSGIEALAENFAKTMALVAKNMQDVAVSLDKAAKAMESLARNSRNIKFPGVEKEAGALSRLFGVIGGLARFFETITSVVANIVTVVRFGRAIGDLRLQFEIASQGAVGFRQRIVALGRALEQTFVPVEKQQQTTERISRAFTNAGRAAGNLGRNVDDLGQKFRRTTQTQDQFNKTQQETVKATVQASTATQSAFSRFFSSIRGRFREETGAINFSEFFRRASRGAEDATVKTTQFSAALQQTAARSGVFAGLIERIRNSFTSFGAAIRSAATAISTFITGIFSRIGSFFSNIRSSIGSFVSSLGSIRDAFTSVASVANFFQGAIGRVGLAFEFLGSAGAAGAAIAAITAVGVAFTKVILSIAQGASTLNESQNAIAVTLGNAADRFRELIGVTSELGLSQNKLNEAITPIVPLLKNAGLSGDELASKLNEVVRRAVDLSSIFNRDVSESLGAIGAGLRGEINPLERFGVAFNALEVDAKAAALGFKKVGSEFTEQTKQLVRLQLILEKSSFAMGDFQNTSEGLANAQRILRANLEEVRTAISAAFLPAAQQIVQVFIRLTKESGPALVAFFTSITPLITQFAILIENLAPVVTAISGVFRSVLVPVLTKFIQVLNFISPLLQVLLARFLILRTVTTVITGLRLAVSLLPSAFGLAATAASALGLAINTALIGPVGLIITGLTLLLTQTRDTTTAIAELTKATSQEISGKFFEELDKQTASASQSAKDFFTAIIFGVKRLEETEVKRATKLLDELFAASPEAARRFVDQAQKEGAKFLPQLQQELGRLNTALEERNKELAASVPITEQVIQSEKDLAEAFKSLFEGTESIGSFLTRVFSSGKLKLDEITKSFRDFTKTLLEPLDPFQAAISSAENLKSAKERVAAVDKQINDLNKQRKVLLSDTTRQAREEAEARDKILDIERQLRDLQQEREQLIFDEQRRQQEFQPTLEEFSDQQLQANINLAKAKREVEDAEKAINEAIKAGIQDETIRLNLVGLSVDQIRSRLSNIRASLAAQNAIKKVEEDTVDPARQKEELQERLLESQIGLRDAEREITNLAQQHTDFIRDQSIAQREFNEKIAELATQEASLNRNRTEALFAQQQLLRGEIGVRAELRKITEQLTSLDRDRAQAAQAVAAAEKEAQIAAATARGDVATVLQLTRDILVEKAKGVGLDEATSAALDKVIAKLDTQRAKVGELQTVIDQLNRGGITAGGTFLPTGLFVAGTLEAQLATAAMNLLGAARDLESQRRNIEALARATGTSLPFQGAEGGVFSTATNAIIGEAGKEVLLPLTRPWRMETLMSRPDVLNPILATLPRIRFPEPAGLSPTLSVSPTQSPNLPASVMVGGSPVLTYKEREKERRALAKEIADALIARGIMSPNLEVHAPVTIQTPGVDTLQERAIVNRIMKEIEGRF